MMKSVSRKRSAWLCAMIASAVIWQVPGISEAAEADDYELDQVVVTANRVPTKLSESAANITVITKEQLEQRHYSSLGDALRAVNGVIVSGKGFHGANQAVRLNGDDRVLIMIDGRRISRPEGTGNDRANLDLSTMISLSNIERIEIVKGGASALYGSDAVGGVINIITRQGQETQNTVSVSGGSWGERNYALSMQGREDGFGWYLTVDKKHQDYSEYNVLNSALNPGSHKGDTYRWKNSDFDGQGLTLRLDKELDEQHSWTFNLEHWSDEGGQPYSISYASDAQSSHLSNNLAFTYNFNQQDQVPGYARIYSNYHHQEFYGPYESRTNGFQYQTGWQFNDKNKAIVGTEWVKSEVMDSTGGYQNKSITNAAIYGQDIYNLTNKITLTPGIRYDHHSKFGGQTTPKVNINYNVDKNTDVYVAYNRVFNAPNLDDLYYDNYYQGNPNLKPEKGYVVSTGLNKKFNNQTSVKVNYFSSELSNAIHWYPDDPSDRWNSVWRAYNITKEKKHGVELDINHRFSEKYYADFGYSYVHLEQEGDNYGIITGINTQPNGYRVNVGYSDHQWGINVGAQGVSGRDTTRFTDSSYWIWNVAANYQVNKATQVYIKGNNLSNEAYEINYASTKGDYPMPARNYQFGVNYQF